MPRVIMMDTVKDHKRRKSRRMEFYVYSMLLFVVGLIFYYIIPVIGVWAIFIAIIMFIMNVIAGRLDKKEYK